MNIVIHLGQATESLDAVITGIQAVLSAHGLSSEVVNIAGMNVMSCNLVPKPDTVCAGCDNPECVNCGINPSEAPYISPDKTIASDEPVPAEETVAELPAPELSPAPTTTEPVVDREFGPAKVLTLSTHFLIPTKLSHSANTVLKTTGRILADNIVRFTFNGFEHALPVADANDKSIVNNTHNCGPSTVRLVVDITNRTYACLVDIEGGDSEELLIGDDLVHFLMETAADVPAEQH